MSPSARCLPHHTEETYQAFKVAVIERTHTWLERLSRTVAPQQIGSPPIVVVSGTFVVQKGYGDMRLYTVSRGAI